VLLPVIDQIQRAGWSQKLIKSAISSRYGPIFVPQNLLAAFPSNASAIRAPRRSISAKSQEGYVITRIHAMIPNIIPIDVILFAIYFFIGSELLTHKSVPSMVERAPKDENYPYDSSRSDCSEKLF
jgi:hypothetical protein